MHFRLHQSYDTTVSTTLYCCAQKEGQEAQELGRYAIESSSPLLQCSTLYKAGLKMRSPSKPAPIRATSSIANLGLYIAKASRKHNPVPGPGDRGPLSIPEVIDSEEIVDLQFVNTTSTGTIDELSKRVVRECASRYGSRAKPSSGASTKSPETHANPSGSAGQIHRFRLGPHGLKHTPKQPLTMSARLGQAASQSKQKTVDREDKEEESFPEPVSRATLGHAQVNPSLEKAGERGRWAGERQQTWLRMLEFPRGNSIYGPSSGAMDPFSSMSLNITPREEIWLHHYCKHKFKHGRYHPEVISSRLSRCVVISSVSTALGNTLEFKTSPIRHLSKSGVVNHLSRQ
jgi:hypothetical protein